MVEESDAMLCFDKRNQFGETSRRALWSELSRRIVAKDGTQTTPPLVLDASSVDPPNHALDMSSACRRDLCMGQSGRVRLGHGLGCMIHEKVSVLVKQFNSLSSR